MVEEPKRTIKDCDRKMSAWIFKFIGALVLLIGSAITWASAHQEANNKASTDMQVRQAKVETILEGISEDISYIRRKIDKEK